MKSLIVAIPVVLLLLTGLSEASGYSRCYHGFNVTVGGIPYRLWRKQVCPDGKSCMIQEVSLSAEGVDFADVAIRYGGCFSRDLQNAVSCSPSKFRAKENGKTRNVLELLDEKISEFVTDLHNDLVSKLRKNSAVGPAKGQDFIDFFTEGNSFDEFCNGILNFFGLLGYDKQEIETPFRDFIRAFVSDRSSHDEARFKLLKMMATDNDATITLSNSVLARAIDNEQVYEIPLNVSDTVKFVTGLIYPVVDYLNTNADEILQAISEHIESQDNALSVKSCHATLRYLVAVQLVASTVDLVDIEGTSDIIYKISRDISEACLEAYSEDTEVKFMKFAIDGIRSIHRQATKCYGESPRNRYVLCTNRYLLSIILLPLKLPFPVLSSLKPIHEVLLQPFRYQKRWLTHIFDHTGEESIREDIKLLKHVLELFPNRSCREYVCHCMLCNSHAVFVNYKDDQEMNDREGLGNQEEMELKSEL